MKDGLDCGSHDEAAGSLGGAGVQPDAECQVCAVTGIDAVVRPGPGVAVGCGQPEDQCVAAGDVLAGEDGVTGGPAGGLVSHRRVPPQHFVERVRDNKRTMPYVGLLVGESLAARRRVAGAEMADGCVGALAGMPVSSGGTVTPIRWR